jgi:hypothetical protein
VFEWLRIFQVEVQVPCADDAVSSARITAAWWSAGGRAGGIAEEWGAIEVGRWWMYRRE